MTFGRGRTFGEAPNGASPRLKSAVGEVARARSALEAAQSDLHTIQMKLAPLRMQEQRARAKLADAAHALRLLDARPEANSGRSEASPVGRLPADLVELARLYEGRPCDSEEPSA